MMEDPDENIPIDSITLAKIQKALDSYAESQRLSTILIWIGITLVIIHTVADIYFHLIL